MLTQQQLQAEADRQRHDEKKSPKGSACFGLLLWAFIAYGVYTYFFK